MPYVLDTNIISQAMKPRPSAVLTAWLEQQLDAELFVCSLTLGEIKRGLLELKPRRRRRELEAWFIGPEGPPLLFRGRVLPFDERAAVEWARLMAEGTAAGRPRSALDMVIAATAVANGCTVVTANDRHFRGAVELFNPLVAG